MVKLPNIDAAVIEDAKLIDYLLNPAHPWGAAKARFLESFGFSSARPDEARAAFQEHARRHDIVATQLTPFGTIYEGALPSPDGREPVVRVVWMHDIGAAAPRLITMIPRPGRRTRRSP